MESQFYQSDAVIHRGIYTRHRRIKIHTYMSFQLEFETIQRFSVLIFRISMRLMRSRFNNTRVSIPLRNTDNQMTAQGDQFISLHVYHYAPWRPIHFIHVYHYATKKNQMTAQGDQLILFMCNTTQSSPTHQNTFKTLHDTCLFIHLFS